MVRSQTLHYCANSVNGKLPQTQEPRGVVTYTEKPCRG